MRRRYYSPECLAYIEYRLQQYPLRKQQLDAMADNIERQAYKGVNLSQGAIPGGYSGTSEPERVLMAKESNPRYVALEKAVTEVEMALKCLKPKAREFIQYRYWEGASMDVIADLWRTNKRALWRYRFRLLNKLVPLLLPQEAI